MPTELVLLVCTANQCRSPMAEVLLADELARRGVPTRVGSAGLGRAGVPAAPEAVRALARRGLSLEDHRSRTLDAALLAEADLVVTMERRHLQAVGVLDAQALERAFACRALLRAAEGSGPRADGLDLAGWARSLSFGRRPADLVGSGHEDDVADPIGRSARQFEATAEELAGLMCRLADLAFPGTGPARPPAGGAPPARRRRWSLRRGAR